jgi:uncharacterized membrane protein
VTGGVLRVVVRRYLIAGLVVWVPILVTVLVERFISDLMDNFLLLLPPALRPERLFGVYVPGLGVLLAFVLLLLTGLLVSNMIGRSLVGYWEDLLNRIPFIRAIYNGVKSFSSTILSGSSKSFKKVLLIQYPREGIWSIGFQTAADIPWLNSYVSEPQVCVFIPTTPNPTSGFIMLVPRSQAIELDMSIDEAMKMIVTLGVVVPEAALPTVIGRAVPAAEQDAAAGATQAAAAAGSAQAATAAGHTAGAAAGPVAAKAPVVPAAPAS